MEHNPGLPYRYILGGASLIPIDIGKIVEGGEIYVDIGLHDWEQIGEMNELTDSGIDWKAAMQLTEEVYGDEPFACSVVLTIESAEVENEVRWSFRGQGRLIGIVPTQSIIFRKEVPIQEGQTFKYEAFCVPEVSVLAQMAFIDTDISLVDAVHV